MSEELESIITEFDSDQGILEWLDKACKIFKEKTAIEWNDKQISYGTLDSMANRLTNFLIANQLSKGSIIALLIDDRIEFIASIIGILRAGCVFVPLDPKFPDGRLCKIIADVSPDCFIIEAKFNSLVTKIKTDDNKTSKIIHLAENSAFNKFDGNIISINQSLANSSTERQFVSVDPNDMCYIYYTSGSTGTPKGIAGRLKGISHFIRWEIQTFNIAPEWKFSQFTMPTFDAFLRDIFTPLCVGGTICIPPDKSTTINSTLLIDWINSKKINLIHCVPSLFGVLASGDLNPHKFNSLKYILMAGESLPVSDVKKWVQIYDTRIKLINLYGATETTMVKFYYEIQKSDINRDFIPIGKPIEGAEAMVLDEYGNVCSCEVFGELYINTPYQTLGYYNNPELTKKVFVKNPFSENPNDTIYKTGDLARLLNDGNYQFGGRKDNQVKIRGIRVELEDIENQLRNHDFVESAIVLFREDEPGERRLVAYIVPKQKTALTVSDLRHFIQERLPDYMVPSVFVILETFPLTSNGKVDRRALPTPNTSGKSLEVDFVVPHTSTQELIAAIFSEVLGLEQVGIYDNFFALGGHSLLVIKVISRLQQTFNVELSVLTLFEAPTVVELGTRIETVCSTTQKLPAFLETLTPNLDLLAKSQEPKIQAGAYQQAWWGKDNEYPLSPELELFWISSQLTSGNTFSPKFSIQNSSIWECEFNPVLFQRACDLVVERNEILRTRLVRKGFWIFQLLSKLLPGSLTNVGSQSKLKRLEQAIIALLAKPNSVPAKLLHQLISLKIQVETALVRQKVLPPQPVHWDYHNYESVSNEAALQCLIGEIAIKEGEYIFNLEMGPLFRCAVIKNWNNTHTVIVTAHHGFVDFIGVQQVTDELHTVYQALLRNELNSLAPRPQYCHYATRLASLKNSDSYKLDIEFWRKHFAQCNPTTVVPSQPNTYHREDFRICKPIDQETAALIYSYCQQISLPASAFFLAGYYLFLYRLTGQSHLYTLVNNGIRPDLENEETIGTFLQIFPLAVNLKETSTIADLIQASAKNIFAFLEHRKVSLPCLISHDIQIAAATMKQPVCLFQVIQTTQKLKQLHRSPRGGVDAIDWGFSILIYGSNEYHVNVTYNTAFYNHEYVENLLDEYKNILAFMAKKSQDIVLNILNKSFITPPFVQS
ncbi:amino acid adenylation domain-containing protein [Calothrix sp. NIES-4071]|nr:amino acid adenylation domain-containing protein [Calothrix sp. NIES-4071]BAZ57031.1 amino acid adenylation domain-containing protein [Calothrix sp. NIES-4105]